jgi:hypothetical protein
MIEGIQLMEWLVKTAIADESISTDHIVSLMRKNNITSTHLVNYVNEDRFWPLHEADANIPAKDEKYVLNLTNPQEKRALKEKRERLLEAIESRFYTGHKFNEWLV